MRKVLLLAILIVQVACLVGCGGGGGAAPAAITITGTVEDVAIGTPNPPAQIQVGTSSTVVNSSASDGSFSISAPAGTTELRVDRRDGSALFVFTFPAISVSSDVGQLWIGPSRITATGRAIDSNTLQPIAGAVVNLGGATATSGTDGTFTLSGVAYSAAGLFSNMPGAITATGYISGLFTPSSAAVSGSSLAIGDVGLVPSTSSTPPGAPYNIWGRVSPLASGSTSVSPGTVVKLSIGSTAYRSTTVAADGTYYFWVPAGAYTLSFAKSGYSAPNIAANLTASNLVLEEDATLTATP